MRTSEATWFPLKFDTYQKNEINEGAVICWYQTTQCGFTVNFECVCKFHSEWNKESTE